MAIDYTGGGATDERVITKRAIFEHEIRSLVETDQLMAPISTKLVSKAKYVEAPFVTSGDAKNFEQDCVVPVSPIAISNDEMVINRNVGDSHVECDVDFSYAKFDLLGDVRRNLYATMYKKLNANAWADFSAGATDETGTPVSLATTQEVQDFLIKLKAEHEFNVVKFRTKVEGATIKRCEYEGKIFLLAGSAAYVNLISKLQTTIHQSSLKGMDGRFVDTPYGVRIFNMGDTPGVGANDMLWGVGGVPVMAYRDDQIEYGMGNKIDTITATAADLDITAGDTLLEKMSYMYAKVKTNNWIFPQMASHVKYGVMA